MAPRQQQSYGTVEYETFDDIFPHQYVDHNSSNEHERSTSFISRHRLFAGNKHIY